jgi:hypothetical protein
VYPLWECPSIGGSFTDRIQDTVKTFNIKAYLISVEETAMQEQSFRTWLWQSPLRRSKKVFTSISLSLGIVLGSFAVASLSETAQSAQAQQPAPTAAQPSVPTQLEDGVYLFGQAAEPDQIGKAYLVFEVKDSRMVGAFYMPRSSFDCVYGNFQPNQLALTVVNSYDQSTYPYEIAVRRNNPVATAGNSAEKKLGLEGMHQLTKVSENDERILGVCKANFPQALN